MENTRMDEPVTLSTILSNAFNKDYTADQAVAELTRLMNEATLVEIEHGTDSPEYAELQRLITVQEKLAKAKLKKHPIFDELGSLSLAPQKDD